jgi:hypothetical protein
MAIDPSRLQVDQITNILQNLGWEVIASDVGGQNMVLTIRKPKEIPGGVPG